MGVPVPEIQEQIDEVIKVILQEQCQQMRFFSLLERVGRGAVGCTGRACCPTVSATRECWRVFLSRACGEGGGLWAARSARVAASDRIWNMLFSTNSHTSLWVRFSGCLMLFSTCSHTFKRVRSNGCLSLVVAQASANLQRSLGSCAILEQRVDRHSHSTTAAASVGRHLWDCSSHFPPERRVP